MGRADAFMEPDLKGIVEAAKQQYGWTAAQADSAESWYRAFLQVVYRNPGGIAYIVTDEAHQLWDTHRYFECRYRPYCEAILGFYLDHSDPLRVVSEQAEADAAKAAYGAIEGQPLIPIDLSIIKPDLIKPCC